MVDFANLGSLDSLQREQDESSRRLSGGTPGPKQDEGGAGFFGTLGDLALSPLRGAEGALQDVYGLADAVSGGRLSGTIFDYDERVFGESRTAVGGLAEGVFNFAAGFVPVVGALGKVGKVGRVFNVTKKAQRAARIAGRAKQAKRIGTARALIAGAATDFAVFDAHEGRLSDLIQNIPALENPISALLATDEDDGQAEGRLKNVIEGLGMGFATDLLVRSVKALGIGRRLRAKGKGAKEVQEAMDEALPPGEARSILNGAKDGDLLSATLKQDLPTDNLKSVGQERVAADARNAAGEAILDGPDTTGAQVRDISELNPEFRGLERAEPDQLFRAMGLDEGDASRIAAELSERQRAGLEGGVNPRELTNEELLANRLGRGDLNLKQFRGTEGAMQMLRVAERMAETAARGDDSALKKLGSATESLSERAEDNLKLVMDYSGETDRQSFMVHAMRGLEEDQSLFRKLNARITMYRGMFDAYAQDMAKDADLINSGSGDSAQNLVEFAERMETLKNLAAGVKGFSAEQGRSFRALRDSAGILDPTSEVFEQGLIQLGGRKGAKKMAAKFSAAFADGNTAGAAHLARGSQGGKFWAWTNEYWFFSLLSSPTTAAVNALSGALTTVYRPLEQMLGGALTLQGDVIADAFRDVTNLAHAMPEAFRYAKKVGGGADNILDPGGRVQDVGRSERRTIFPANTDAEGNFVHSAGARWIGRLIQTPGDILAGTDEFFKQINYRSTARSQLTKKAIKQGLDPQQSAEFVTKEMDRLVFQGQALGQKQLISRGMADAERLGITSAADARAHAERFAVEEMQKPDFAELSMLARTSIDTAREVTFTKPLRPGSLSASVQSAVIRHPYLRLVMPFVRTPINLATFAAQRLDAPGLVRVLHGKAFPPSARSLNATKNRLVREALSNDPKLAADATGRIAAGTMIATTVYQAASDGVITGRGPGDREQRQLLEDAGWQPYSIKIGDKYISYARLDPFATMLGTAADVVNYARWAEDADQPEIEKVTMGVAVALANNFTNKTYLKGVGEVLEMLSDPARNGPRVLQRFGASFAVPAGARALTTTGDENMRDMQGWMDQVYGRTPGLSGKLPPVRNLLGEPVRRVTSLGDDQIGSIANAFLPIAYREVSSDPIRKELAALGHGFSPPRRSRNGLNLSTVTNDDGRDAYDRWGELHGQVRVGGLTLRQNLARLIRSSAYRNMNPLSTHEIESPRIRAINNVVQDYRRGAWRQLLREFPDLNKHERALMRQKRINLNTNQPGERVGGLRNNPFEALLGR